mmetsp:Transcript_6350/g.12909  ORF Transcript_6350/g.12909 Transcript_6350/m.12909 type:complete len:236 (-) Transcript_6350:234-941(-)
MNANTVESARKYATLSRPLMNSVSSLARSFRNSVVLTTRFSGSLGTARPAYLFSSTFCRNSNSEYLRRTSIPRSRTATLKYTGGDGFVILRGPCMGSPTSMSSVWLMTFCLQVKCSRQKSSCPRKYFFMRSWLTSRLSPQSSSSLISIPGFLRTGSTVSTTSGLPTPKFCIIIIVSVIPLLRDNQSQPKLLGIDNLLGCVVVFAKLVRRQSSRSRSSQAVIRLGTVRPNQQILAL